MAFIPSVNASLWENSHSPTDNANLFQQHDRQFISNFGFIFMAAVHEILMFEHVDDTTTNSYYFNYQAYQRGDC